MNTITNVLGLLGYLLLVWLGTAISHEVLSGLATGLITRRWLAGSPPELRTVCAETARGRSLRARQRAAVVAMACALISALALRYLHWDRGNFHVPNLAGAISLGVAMGTLLTIRLLHRDLAPFSPKRRVGAVARREAQPERNWSEIVVSRAQTDSRLRAKVQKAVDLWSQLEDLAGDASMTIDEIFQNPGAVRERMRDRDSALRRAAARTRVEAEFDRALAEVAAEVTRLEGSRGRERECLAALHRDFFDVADRLGM